MGREVRRVPKNWKHPKNQYGPVPLLKGSYIREKDKWVQGKDLWERGEHEDQIEYGWSGDYLEYYGEKPSREDYMPDWPRQVCTHYQMYENTTEGTPISPVMETPEELARWLADTEASAFVSLTADYDYWLRICQGGWAPSAVVKGGAIQSGVEGLDE
jgi:hypothetical protein